jgi:thioredoxin reductase
MEFDVLVVGGGPAGLSAALILGRCHRKTLLCDDGRQRNLSSHAIHGFLGQEGRSPSEFLDQARWELTRYKSVALRATRVTDITPSAGMFEFSCADGTTGSAAKVLIATGLVDELPELPGIDAFYGVSVHHCLYCDGYEYSGKEVAAYGTGDKGAELAVMIKHWTPDVVACSDGTTVSPEGMQRLKDHNIPLRAEPIRRLEGMNGQLKRIIFESGGDLPRVGMFFSTGCHPASAVSERLGCKHGESNGIATNPKSEETNVPGVYVAGDASRDVLLVAVAAAEGAQAAVAINKSFLRRDGLID